MATLMFGIDMRALVYLRRITDALEVLAKDALLRQERELAKPPKPPGKVRIEQFNVEEAERRWQLIQKSREEGIDLEEL